VPWAKAPLSKAINPPAESITIIALNAIFRISCFFPLPYDAVQGLDLTEPLMQFRDRLLQRFIGTLAIGDVFHGQDDIV
jgi:hypothetical protein